MTKSPWFFPSHPVTPRAIQIASQARIGVYDRLYVALAERERCDLLTSDARLNSRAVLSWLPVKMVFPSGENATLKTWPRCSVSMPILSPVAASQSRAVWSALPVRMVLPSGLKATLTTQARCYIGLLMGSPVAASQSRAGRVGRRSPP
jgi:hypothetical protein